MSATDVWTANVLYPQPLVNPASNLTNETNTTNPSSPSSDTSAPSDSSATSPLLNALPSPMPMTYTLDRPVFANSIFLKLNTTSVMKSPYFEVRGCDVEGEGRFKCQKSSGFLISRTQMFSCSAAFVVRSGQKPSGFEVQLL